MKNLKSVVVISLGVLLVEQVLADGYNSAMIRKYYEGALSFDGQKVTDKWDANLNIDNKNKNRVAKDGYEFSWETTEINDKKVLAITETQSVIWDKTKAPKIKSTTATFDNNGLRSKTICKGSGKSPDGDKGTLKCATATANACDRVRRARQTVDPRGGALTKENVKACQDILGAYIQVAKTFAAKDNASEESTRQYTVKTDNERIEKHVKSMTGTLFSPVSISAINKDEKMDRLVEDFTGTMDGLQVLNDVMDTCDSAIFDFGPTTGSSAQSLKKSNNAR
jgi:hypothetical protein